MRKGICVELVRTSLADETRCHEVAKQTDLMGMYMSQNTPKLSLKMKRELTYQCVLTAGLPFHLAAANDSVLEVLAEELEYLEVEAHFDDSLRRALFIGRLDTPESISFRAFSKKENTVQCLHSPRATTFS